MYTSTEIDFDVFKALTGLRVSEDATFNDVIRGLLKLPPARSSSERGKGPTKTGDWVVKGVRFPSGTAFRAKYKGSTVTGVVADGALRVNGHQFRTPSAAAGSITGGASTNGWTFWECRAPGATSWRTMDAVRRDG